MIIKADIVRAIKHQHEYVYLVKPHDSLYAGGIDIELHGTNGTKYQAVIQWARQFSLENISTELPMELAYLVSGKNNRAMADMLKKRWPNEQQFDGLLIKLIKILNT